MLLMLINGAGQKKSGQWLESVDGTHLVLAIGYWPVLQRNKIAALPNRLLTNFQIYKDVKNRNARQMSMSRTAATTTQQARRKQVGAFL